jgi:hypothetical protein
MSDKCRERYKPIITTTMPSYTEQKLIPAESLNIPVKIGEKLTYNLLWEIALDCNPNIVLTASWNNYYEGSSIEPTIQLGNLFLEKTEYWASIFKAPISL